MIVINSFYRDSYGYGLEIVYARMYRYDLELEGTEHLTRCNYLYYLLVHKK